MRVLFLVGQFPSLSETFILNQITGLADGVEVDILAESKPLERKQHPDVSRYGLEKRTRYIDMPKERIQRVIKGLAMALANMHRNPGMILRSLDFIRYGETALSMRLLYTAIPLLDGGYDIVHCHFGQNGVTGACLKDIGVKGRLVTSFYGNDLSAYVAENPKAYARLFSNGDLFIPISEDLKGKLTGLGCDGKKITVHHMGIRLGAFEYPPRTVKKGEPLGILTVGRLVEKKGHEYSIKAFAKTAAGRDDIRYMIAGDGPLKERLQSLAEELEVGDKIDFLGEVDQDDAIGLYRKAHIFVLSSVTASDGDQEGVPVVLMEAQATGLPTLSTRHSGIPEVVEDGKTGFLVPEKDVDALADKLGYLIDHPELWPAMGKAGRRLVEEKYDSDKLNKRLVELYQGLLKQ